MPAASDRCSVVTCKVEEDAVHECSSQQDRLGVVIASIGLATDFYDFGVVNNVKTMLQTEFGEMTTAQNTTLSASAIIGAVFGQICIGMLADRFGRRAMFLLCSTLTFVGALLSAVAWNPGGNEIYWLLILFRFIMGFGIGGEYPCCASHMAETSHAENSGRNMALGVAAMAVGGVCAPAIVLICLTLGLPHALVWRIAFGLGALVSLVSLALRVMTVKNSKKFEAVQENQSFTKAFKLLWREYRIPLLGTAGAWFWYDLVDYGLGLYSAKVSGVATGQGEIGTTLNTLFFALLALPGAYAASCTLPYWGRKNSFLVGFTGMIVVFFLLVTFFDQLPPALFTILYGLQLSFDYIGPCPASYAVPGEIFPTAARATAHGISAACGKMGAVVGVYCVGILADTVGVRWMLLVVGCLTIVAMLWVQFLIPQYNENTLRHLDEVAESHDVGEIRAFIYGGGMQGKPSKETNTV